MDKQRGSILLICLYIISALIIIGAAFSVLMANERLSSEHDIQAVNALYLAEAGLEKTVYDLRQQYSVNASWNGSSINGTTVVPVTGQFYLLYSNVSFSGGTYTVQIMNGANVTDNMWVRSTGICGNIQQTVQAYIIVSDPVGPVLSVLGWENV